MRFKGILKPQKAFTLIFIIIFLLLPNIAYAGTHHDQSGLLGDWHIDEGSDNTCSGDGKDICDFSGNNFNGTNNGATWNGTDCAFGDCYTFDGSNDDVTMVSTPYHDMNDTDKSVCIWVNVWQDISVGSGTIRTAINKGNVGTDRWGISVIKATGLMAFTIHDGSSISTTSTSDVRNAGWTHVCGVFDATNDLMLIYMNGTQEHNASRTGGDVTNANGLLIGDFAPNQNSGRAWLGSLDEPRIYDSALSEAEIQSEMARSINGTPPVPPTINATTHHLRSQLILDYHADEGRGTNLIDYALYDDNATIYDNVSYNTGAYGDYGLFFNGTTASNVTIPYNVSQDSGNDFSICAWVRLQEDDNSEYKIVSNQGGIGNSGWELVSSGTGNEIRMQVYETAGTLKQGITDYGTGDNTIIDKWGFACGVQNSTHVLAYINGITDGATAYTGRNLSTDDLVIGNTPNGLGLGWNGSIDEIRMYNKSLSQSEILTEMRTGWFFLNLTNPENDTVTIGTTSINLNFTIRGNESTYNCSYVLDSGSSVNLGVQNNNTDNSTPFTALYGNHDINLSCDTSLRGNHTITLQEFFTNYFLQWNISILDELTGDPFNMSRPNTTTLNLFCDDQTTTQNITQNNLIFNLSCDYNYARLVMDFDGEEYFRTLIPPVTNTTVDFYMVDITEETLIELVMSIDDFTGDFSGDDTLVRITKIVADTGQQDITEQFVDIENKVILFLITNNLYGVQLENAEGTVRAFGDLVSDIDSQKTLRVSDFPIVGNVSTVYDDINFTISTPNNSSIRIVYQDGSAGTENITFTIYNQSNTSQILFNQTVVGTSSITITWNGANVNESYLWKLDIEHSVFSDIEAILGTISFAVQNRFGIDLDQDILEIIATSIILMMSVVVTGRFSGIAGLITVSAMSYFRYNGVLESLPYETLAVFWFLVIINMIIRGESK